MLQEYTLSVSDVPEGMLQVLYIDVAKVDRMLHMLYGYTHMFQVYVPKVSSVLDVCYKCFTRMLQK